MNVSFLTINYFFPFSVEDFSKTDILLLEITYILIRQIKSSYVELKSGHTKSNTSLESNIWSTKSYQYYVY